MSNNRPSLDVLVPLVMIENNITNDDDNNDTLSCEPEKDLEILRHFESGDIVLIRLDSQCLPAIVFNITGLVMKFDIDRQLYHVCLLNKDFTEQWVDATDMFIYSVPMIAECEDEQTQLMWTTANELFQISNTNDDKTRFEEFKRRFIEIRQQQGPFLSMNISRKDRRSRISNQKTTPTHQVICPPLTTCEELHIIECIYELSPCTYYEAKRTAEENYKKIISTNNRENTPSSSIDSIPNQWFIIFAIRNIYYFRQYSSIWLPDLEAIIENLDNENELYTLISLMKEPV